MKMGASDEATPEFTIVLALDPRNAMARYNMGNIYLSQGRIPDAIAAYEIAIGLTPDYDKAHNGLGIALCQSGQIDAAINEFNRALQINPQNINARKNHEACLARTIIESKQYNRY